MVGVQCVYVENKVKNIISKWLICWLECELEHQKSILLTHRLYLALAFGDFGFFAFGDFG